MAPPLNKPLHVDFVSLRIRDPDFDRLYARKGEKIDFQDAETVTQLTKSILKVEFGLKLEIPSDRLCPPVPIRYEYIRYISSLLASTGPNVWRDELDPLRLVTGIDIGTGASAIYPLLATRQHPAWHMHATEVDTLSFAYAERNISANDLTDRVTIHKISSPEAALIPPTISRATFLICNPPFYTSESDLYASDKDHPPSAICTGSEGEMICPGGDLGFATRILDESMSWTIRIQWYTVMLGKLSSVARLVAEIRKRGISNWIVNTLLVGSATRRWIVGWSHGDRRASSAVARGLTSSNIEDVRPPFNEMTIAELPKDLDTIASVVQGILVEQDVCVKFEPKIKRALVFAKKNVWNRAARRAARKTQGNGAEDDHNDDDDSAQAAYAEASALGVRITIMDDEGEIHLRWIKGNDAVLFESFGGMLKRELKKCLGRT